MKPSPRLPGFSGFSRFSEKVMLAASMTLGLAIPASAQSPGAHVHGQAVLEIAVDGGMVQLNLHSPLDNLLGFEHAPRTGEERRAIQAMAVKLHQADNLFVFTPSARCQLESTHLKSAALSPHLLATVPLSGKSQGTTSDYHNGKAAKPASAPALSQSPCSRGSRRSWAPREPRG